MVCTTCCFDNMSTYLPFIMKAASTLEVLQFWCHICICDMKKIIKQFPNSLKVVHCPNPIPYAW